MQKRIKVCQVSSVHKTFDTRIFHKICKSLTKQYDVIYISANAKNEKKDGVDIIGVEIPSSRWKRVFSLNKIYETMVSVDADVYHFHDPELMSLGAKIRRKKGKKIVFDSHEDGPMQFISKEYLPKWIAVIASWVYTIYEKYYLKQYDAVVSVTPSIVERLKRINPHTYQITNYPKYVKNGQVHEYERKVCFFGGILPQWMHDTIIEAIRATDVTYVLAGPVYPRDLLEKYLQDDKRKQIQYLGVIPHLQCLEIMHHCSAGLAIIDYVPNFGGKLGTLGNNKLFEYMQEGLPVIATDCILWEQIVKKYQCGICVNPHDVNAIKDAILFYANHPDIAAEHGKNGRRAVKDEFNWQTQEVILFEMFNNITERS
jgi:wbpH